MSLIDRFNQYADAFEMFFESGDPKVLEPYFAEEAVYEIQADPPFAARHEGRDKIIQGLSDSVDSFDKRFEQRKLEIVDGPTEHDRNVWIRWRVTYSSPGIPPLAMSGEETATFEGDRIVHLEDRVPPDVVQAIFAWMSKHESSLQPKRS